MWFFSGGDLWVRWVSWTTARPMVPVGQCRMFQGNITENYQIHHSHILACWTHSSVTKHVCSLCRRNSRTLSKPAPFSSSNRCLGGTGIGLDSFLYPLLFSRNIRKCAGSQLCVSLVICLMNHQSNISSVC